MNNKLYLALGGVVVVGALIYFLTMNKSGENETSSSNNSNNQTSQQQTVDQKKSLKDLLASGTQKCEYADGPNKAVVYTANGKSRTEFTTVANGVQMNSQAIIDGQTYYSWVDGQPSGFKFSLNQSSTGSVGSNQNVDINQQFNYNCSGWSVDNSKFNLPANVTFTDLSSFQTGN